MAHYRGQTKTLLRANFKTGSTDLVSGGSYVVLPSYRLVIYLGETKHKGRKLNIGYHQRRLLLLYISFLRSFYFLTKSDTDSNTKKKENKV